MRRTLALLAQTGATSRPNLIQIRGGTFFKEHPAADGSDALSNPPLFPGLNFELPATRVADIGKPARKEEHWAVISANDGTTFLEILRGTHLCLSPNARTFPFLSSDEIDCKDHRLRVPSRAIQYVGFNAGRGQSVGGGLRGAYLSARYEARREETDWSVLQYLKGETELNPSKENETTCKDNQLLQQVITNLRLQKLLNMPVSNLSNGQTRRSRIAKALLGKPELLLLDEPFMGLDPPTLVTLSPMLRNLAYRSSPLLLLALRPQDPIPEWITHLVILGQNHTVALMGHKAQVLFSLHRWAHIWNNQNTAKPAEKQMAERMTKLFGSPLVSVGDRLGENGVSKYNDYADILAADPDLFNDRGLVSVDRLSPEDERAWKNAYDRPVKQRTIQDLLILTSRLPADYNQATRVTTSKRKTSADISNDGTHPSSQGAAMVRQLGDPLIELHSVVVKYGDKVVLGFPPAQPGLKEPGLNMTIRQGTRLALLGPNGSGKTTLLSLLTSDHPHSYSLPIRFFGRSRLPLPGQPGLSLWDIQSRIGHSSPEIHQFFPKRLNVRQVLESAWAETYSARPKLSHERDEMVNAFLRWWEPELRQNKPKTKETPEGEADATHKPYANKDFLEQSYSPFLAPQSAFGTEAAEVPDRTSNDGLEWTEDSNNHAFRVLPFGTQRLLLFLRAIIKQPDIVILDEAFSGLSAETRDKAMSWLEFGETRNLGQSGVVSAPSLGLSTYNFQGLTGKQALVVVSHIKEEIPAFVDEYVRLPGEEEVAESGRPVEFGRCDNGSIRTAGGWNKVWGF